MALMIMWKFNTFDTLKILQKIFLAADVIMEIKRLSNGNENVSTLVIQVVGIRVYFNGQNGLDLWDGNSVNQWHHVALTYSPGNLKL